MRDIFLITDRRITWSECKNCILNEFRDAVGDEKLLVTGKSPKTVQVWFCSDEDQCKLFGVSGGGSDFPEEVKEKIPLTDPYCTNVEFHREKDVCRLISAILPLFPEMYVMMVTVFARQKNTLPPVPATDTKTAVKTSEEILTAVFQLNIEHPAARKLSISSRHCFSVMPK